MYDIDIVNTHSTILKGEFAQLAMLGEGLETQTRAHLTLAVLSFYYLLFLLELASGDRKALFLWGISLHNFSSYHNLTFSFLNVEDKITMMT